MPIWFTLYSRRDPPCEYCKQAKDLLDLYGIDYHEVDINDEGVRDMFKERGFHTVPQIFIEKTSLGGFNALENYLKDRTIDKEIKHKSKGKVTAYRTA